MRGRFAPVRWIAFDAVGTLIEPCPPVGEAYTQVAGRFGSRLSVDEVSSRFRREFVKSPLARKVPPENWPHDPSLQTNEELERGWWRDLVGNVLTDVTDPEACFEELFDHFGQPDSWRCYDDVIRVLEPLTDRGYRLAVASNFDRRLHAVCDGLPELRPLSVRVLSTEAGWRKPSGRFYRSLIEQTGCGAEQVLMIGDSRENDVDGAATAGLPAVWLCRSREEDTADIIRKPGAAWAAGSADAVRQTQKQPEACGPPAVVSLTDLLNLLPARAPAG